MFFAIALGLEMQSMLQKLDQIDYASLRSEPLTKICRNLSNNKTLSNFDFQVVTPAAEMF